MSVYLKRLKRRCLNPGYLGSLIWKFVRFVVLTGLCYVILYTFLIKVINAFKSPSDFIDNTVRFIPKNFTFNNIRVVAASMDYFRVTLNTLFIAGLSAVFQTSVSSLVGYGFARFKFFGNRILFFMVILTLVIPPQTIIIPLFLRFRNFLGIFVLIDHPAPIFIMSLTGLGLRNGLFIFLFRQFFINMPKELEEAAYLDGCGVMATFFKVMSPSAVSLMVTTFLITFSWQWTDKVFNPLFLRNFPVLANVIDKLSFGAMPIIISNYLNIAGLLAILPITVVFIIGQRFFVQSVERAGLVG